MIFGVLKDGVRSAFVRIVRTIVYIIIFLVALYIYGLVSSSKASALQVQGTINTPELKNRTHSATYGNNSNWNGTSWFTATFDSPYYTIPSDNTYDLIAWKIIRLNYHTDYSTNLNANGNYTVSNNVGYNAPISLNSNIYVGSNGDYYTFWYYMGTSDGNVACFTSSEYDNYVFCPIHPGLVIRSFWVEVLYNVPSAGTGTTTIYYEVRSERSFFNYDNTSIISSQQQIVNQQTQTNTYIQQQNSYITDTSITSSTSQSTTALNGLSSQFNDALNGWGGQWSSLTHIVLEPINVLLYAFDGSTTCSPIRLNIPYLNDGQYIELPCMSSIYGTFFSSFIGLFVTVISGFYAYRTIMYIIRTIKDVLDAENDKIEVIDL